MDDSDRLMICRDAQNESSYHMARGAREVLAQKAEIMDACTQALKDAGGNDADQVDEDIEIED